MDRKPIISMIFLAMMLLAYTGAQAQMAVPEMVPSGPSFYHTQFLAMPMSLNYLPPNPAVIQWGAPNRGGGGWMRGKTHDDVYGDAEKKEAQGQYTGGRFVREKYALAAQLGWFSLTYPLPAQSTINHSSAGLSFVTLDNLAIGLSRTRSHQLNDTQTSDLEVFMDTSTIGGSMRFSELFFVGLGYGKDTLNINDFMGGKARGTRNFSMGGLGIRSAGAVLWRVEISKTNKPNFTDARGKRVGDGYDHTQGSLEIGFANMVFGYTSYGAVTTAAGTGEETKLSGSIADFAFTPPAGIAISGRRERSKVDLPGLPEAKYETINSLAVNVQF
ncbi:MAG: hypothetical protein OEZ59_05035 [Deltaproteobacteria bacterium]|nr:hypothetical protein [Deltaproteobacteria bacterium]